MEDWKWHCHVIYEYVVNELPILGIIIKISTSYSFLIFMFELNWLGEGAVMGLPETGLAIIPGYVLDFSFT